MESLLSMILLVCSTQDLSLNSNIDQECKNRLTSCYYTLLNSELRFLNTNSAITDICIDSEMQYRQGNTDIYSKEIPMRVKDLKAKQDREDAEQAELEKQKRAAELDKLFEDTVKEFIPMPDKAETNETNEIKTEETSEVENVQ